MWNRVRQSHRPDHGIIRGCHPPSSPSSSLSSSLSSCDSHYHYPQKCSQIGAIWKLKFHSSGQSWHQGSSQGFSLLSRFLSLVSPSSRVSIKICHAPSIVTAEVKFTRRYKILSSRDNSIIQTARCIVSHHKSHPSLLHTGCPKNARLRLGEATSAIG